MIGPNGEKRPRETLPLHIAEIAADETGEVCVDQRKWPRGRNGAHPCANALTPQQRRQITKEAVSNRWGDRKP